MKKITTLLFSLCWLFSSSLLAQPINDDCLGIIDLGEAPICPFPDTVTNFEATLSTVFSDAGLNIPSCFNGGIDRDVWFQFDVPVDGSIIDFTIEITGVDGPNGSILQPQIAVYRGECLLDEMEELSCATSLAGETSVVLDLLGLDPGFTYFIRINDWSASAAPNWGDFVVCVNEYVPAINIDDVDFTTACFGTLYDSGGPDGDYSDGENNTLTICPDALTECITMELLEFNIENNFDNLIIYAGDNTGGTQIATFTGVGGPLEIPVNEQCITIQFTSDGSVTNPGFELTWQCLPEACDVPPIVDCDNPIPVPGMPFSDVDLSTCFAGNSIQNGPCPNDGFISGEDYIFAYDSPGDECIMVEINGAAPGTGVGVYLDCPGNPGAECIANAGGGTGTPLIDGAFLEEPGTYYIVVANGNSCTSFDISMEVVTCPIVFPSAADCSEALSLNGCGDLPAVISVGPGEGDPDFLTFDVNTGCWGGFFPLNFTFFFFEAQEDGDFGFTVQSNDPNEASDIDFLVWGPFDPMDDACDIMLTQDAIRSSYAAGADPTGLADIHPILGTPVTDECEDAGGDDFVSTVPVQTGEVYFVLINDWGGQIVSGAVQIDFDATTPGVLDGVGASMVSVTADTVACQGDEIQLEATGGEVYQWFPSDGLSCSNCPNPVATIDGPVSYNVAIIGICTEDTLGVNIDFVTADAGPDLELCLNATTQLSAGSNFASVTYEWQGPAGTLSCTDCAEPFLTATSVGTFEYIVFASGSDCSATDTMTVTVFPGEAPAFTISDDAALCEGESLSLGGLPNPDVSYIWSSNPIGFSSNEANPVVTPTENTTYYLEASNLDCPFPTIDSVVVTVAPVPLAIAVADTSICLDESVQLSTLIPEGDVVYSWSPIDGLDDPMSPNPIATPAATTTYVLTANRDGCIVQDAVTITVIEADITVENPDTVTICQGESVGLSAFGVPGTADISWFSSDPNFNFDGAATTITPQETNWYFATLSEGGCVRLDSVFVAVDSLPELDIMADPEKDTYCQGELITLFSTTYEEANFPDIDFMWTPDIGQQSPDTLFNLVITAEEDAFYIRNTVNGVCASSDSIFIEVIETAGIQIEPQNASICEGESIQLTATTTAAVEGIMWEGPGLSCTDCLDPTATPTSGGAITYTVEAENNGCPVSASTTVDVLNAPPYLFPSINFVCPGESIQLNALPGTVGNYSWTATNGFSSTVSSPTDTPTENTTYFLEASNGDCSVLDTLTIFVAQNFELVTSSDQVICPGESASLFASADAEGVVFSWTDASGQAVGNGENVTPSPTGTTTYTVTAGDPAGCFTNTAEIVVSVAELPIVDSLIVLNQAGEDITNTEIPEGISIQLATFTTPSPIVNGTYDWFENGSLLVTTSVANTELFNAPAVEDDATVTYEVLVTDELGCDQSLAIEVFVKNLSIQIPNIFTPDGNGLNDSFKVLGPETLEVMEFRIYNRWGQLVYGNEDGQAAWDGRQNGELAPSDTYAYYVVVRVSEGTEPITEQGEVTLLR